MLMESLPAELTKAFAYYDARSGQLQEFFPEDLESSFQSAAHTMWQHPIARKILVEISENDRISVPQLKTKIGHSMSTLHETISKLEESGLISTHLSYEGKKQKVLTPHVVFVTRNANMKRQLNKFFQGIWVDSKATTTIVDFLNSHPKKYYTAEEIAVKTRLPLDKVELLLNNWDSFVTRPISSAFKECPFEKKTFYRGSSM